MALRFPDPRAAGSVRCGSLPPQIPLRTLSMGLASLPLLSQQTGWERVKFLPGVPEPDCKVIPAFSSDLLRTYCVPGAQPSAAMGRK